MRVTPELLKDITSDLSESLIALHRSWEKLQNSQLPPLDNKNLDDWEPWEAFTSRFARCTDIFLSKYLRARILQLDPGFRGEIRDFVDKAEKAHLISDADLWMQIRELRNRIAHEYSREDITGTLQKVQAWTPFVTQELGQVLK